MQRICTFYFFIALNGSSFINNNAKKLLYTKNIILRHTKMHRYADTAFTYVFCH